MTGGTDTLEEEIRKCLSHGSISMMGRRRAMEDALTVLPGVAVGELNTYDFFAVYDGHGGSLVANACRDRLHQLITNEMEGITTGGSGGLDWEKVMAACFSKMDAEVNGGGYEKENMTVKNVGSTAMVVMVGNDEVVVANCGDSRAVLCRAGAAVPLSRDRKRDLKQPDRPDEKERVEAAGDQYMKPCVIPEPGVTVSMRTEQDDFLVIASDGLWDVASNEVACEVVRRSLKDQIKREFSEGESSGSWATKAASTLAGLAIARGSKDNISVIVVELKNSR